MLPVILSLKFQHEPGQMTPGNKLVSFQIDEFMMYSSNAWSN